MNYKNLFKAFIISSVVIFIFSFVGGFIAGISLSSRPLTENNIIMAAHVQLAITLVSCALGGLSLWKLKGLSRKVAFVAAVLGAVVNMLAGYILFPPQLDWTYSNFWGTVRMEALSNAVRTAYMGQVIGGPLVAGFFAFLVGSRTTVTSGIEAKSSADFLTSSRDGSQLAVGLQNIQARLRDNAQRATFEASKLRQTTNLRVKQEAVTKELDNNYAALGELAYRFQQKREADFPTLYDDWRIVWKVQKAVQALEKQLGALKKSNFQSQEGEGFLSAGVGKAAFEAEKLRQGATLQKQIKAQQKEFHERLTDAGRQIYQLHQAKQLFDHADVIRHCEEIAQLQAVLSQHESELAAMEKQNYVSKRPSPPPSSHLPETDASEADNKHQIASIQEQIRPLKQNVTQQLSELGKQTYQLYWHKKIDQPSLCAICAEVDTMRQQMAANKKQLAALKVEGDSQKIAAVQSQFRVGQVEIKDKLPHIGRASFGLYQQGQLPQPELQEHCDQIVRLQDQLDDYHQLIHDFESRQDESKSKPEPLMCPICGVEFQSETAVCPHCDFQLPLENQS